MFPTLIGMVFLSSSPDLGKADVWADDPGRMWSTRNLHNIIILLNTNFNFLICNILRNYNFFINLSVSQVEFSYESHVRFSKRSQVALIVISLRFS